MTKHTRLGLSTYRAAAPVSSSFRSKRTHTTPAVPPFQGIDRFRLNMAAQQENAHADPLAAFRIQGLPPTFYYVANFITEEEEASILQKV